MENTKFVKNKMVLPLFGVNRCEGEKKLN
jgi:hypothetical protein